MPISLHFDNYLLHHPKIIMYGIVQKTDHPTIIPTISHSIWAVILWMPGTGMIDPNHHKTHAQACRPAQQFHTQDAGQPPPCASWTVTVQPSTTHCTAHTCQPLQPAQSYPVDGYDTDTQTSSDNEEMDCSQHTELQGMTPNQVDSHFCWAPTTATEHGHAI